MKITGRRAQPMPTIVHILTNVYKVEPTRVTASSKQMSEPLMKQTPEGLTAAPKLFWLPSSMEPMKLLETTTTLAATTEEVDVFYPVT